MQHHVGPGEPSQADLDNHANQLNPNTDEYWHSRDTDCENQAEYDTKHGDDE
jgi:hypothetical protein